MIVVQELESFFAVIVVTVVVAGAISSLYATGLLLWARGTVVDNKGGAHITTRLGAVVCFAACVIIVLFALWLMIPLFH